MSGRKIIEAVEEAARGNFSRITTLGQIWVRDGVDKAMAERAFKQRDALAMAIVEILKANDEFRAGMPDGWEGDPLQDACNDARTVLRATGNDRLRTVSDASCNIS